MITDVISNVNVVYIKGLIQNPDEAITENAIET